MTFATEAQRAAFSTMAFNPHQRRGPDGKWIKMGGGGSSLPEGDTTPGGVSEEDDELYRELRSEYGWNLHEAATDIWQATRERETDPDPRWLEADPQWEPGDGDTPLRKLIRNLEWDLEDSPETADAAMELLLDHIKAEYPESVAGLPEPPERGALAQLHPRADASDGYEGERAARADALTAALRSGVAAQKPLSAGFMGDTRMLTLNDGSQAVYKRAISTLRPGDLNWEVKDQTDAEHLSSLLAGAVGAPAPVVHRLNDTELAMELVSGRPADASALTDARRRDILATDDAVRIGLLDVLLNNTDRHGGNWMVDDAGGPVAIDHGMAFTANPPAGTSGAIKSPFATEHFINPDGTFKSVNSLTRSDVTRLEREIERIRPQFERAGRTDWLDAALGRLRQLGEYARGSMLPAVTAAQRSVFTLATQRALFAVMAFNPHQRRGPDGRWIKMGGRGSAGGSKRGHPEPGTVARENDDQRVTRTGERAYERSLAADRLYKRFRTDEWFDRSDKEIDRREGVRSYFANSQQINAQLRTGERTEGTDELIREVDQAMTATKTRQPLLVYRGVSRDVLGGKGEGDIVTDPAYWSTSMDWEQARKFSRNPNTVILHIEVPEGSNVIAENATETEVLLPRGSAIQITKIDGDAVYGVLQPRGAAVTAAAQHAAFTLAAQRAAFALFAFNPHQRRGPDGRWIKMPTSELKRPRRPRKSKTSKPAVESPKPVTPRAPDPDLSDRIDRMERQFRAMHGPNESRWPPEDRAALALARHEASGALDPDSEVPQVLLADTPASYRAARDPYNAEVLAYARAAQARTRAERGRPDETLQIYIDSVEESLRDDPDDLGSIDENVDYLREQLDIDFGGIGGLPPRPPGAHNELPPSPLLPPGRRTSGGVRPPLTDPYGARREALDRSIRSGIVDQDVISGGKMGDTRRVILADGTEAIYKRAQDEWVPGWDIKEQTDAEELGALVAAAVGVRAPAIQRVDDANLYMEVMPGVTGAARHLSPVPQQLSDSPQGMRMGLLDVLLNNTDRHPGNWLIDLDDNLAAIDHGLAFKNSDTERSSTKYGPFTGQFVSYDGGYADSNPLTRRDVEQIRSDLGRIRPRFEELGRTDWLDQVEQRLDRLSNRAAGYRPLLEDAPAMFQ